MRPWISKRQTRTGLVPMGMIAAMSALWLLFCPFAAESSPAPDAPVSKPDDPVISIHFVVEEAFRHFDDMVTRSNHLFESDPLSENLRKDGRLFADYLELFKHPEFMRLNTHFLWELDQYQEKKGKLKSMVNFQGIDTYDLVQNPDDAIYSFLLLMGSLLIFAGLIFGYIPIKPGLAIIVLWIIFWKPVVSFILLVLPDKIITLLKTVLQRI